MLDTKGPGQMIQADSGDESDVKSYRVGLRHPTRVEADIEFALDASGYGQDATTGWAAVKSQHGMDLAIVTQPEDFHKQPWQDCVSNDRARASGALSALSFRFEKFRKLAPSWLGPQPPRWSPRTVFHLHLESSGIEPLSRLCIRAFCGLNNVPNTRRGDQKCGTPQRSGVGERGENGVHTRRCMGKKGRNNEAKVNNRSGERGSRRDDHRRKRNTIV